MSFQRRVQELYHFKGGALIGNGRKLQRASTNMEQGSWIFPRFLCFSSLYAINLNTQYKYEEQTNL